MSEQKPTGFMAELDQWTDTYVIGPVEEEARLTPADQQAEFWQALVSNLKHSIRAKVLESYKNGIKAGIAKAHSRPAGKETSHAPKQTR